MSLRRLTLLTAFLFTFVVAQIVGAELLFYMSATFLSLVAIAWLVSRMSLKGVQVERFLISSAREGDEVELRLRLLHNGRFPRLFVTVREKLPEWVLPVDGQEMHVIPALFPGCPATLSQRILLKKRGHYDVGPVTLVGNDPLGLFASPTTQRAVRDIVVYPRTIPIRSLGFGREGTVGISPNLQVTSRADGPDFHGVREYLPGDELRRIHWKSTAHRGEFSVIEFEESLASDATVFLDLKATAQRGVGTNSTLEVGIRMAATIVEFLVLHGVAVQLIGDSELLLPPSFGWDPNHLHRMMEALAKVAGDSKTDISELMQRYASCVSRGSTVVLISPEVSVDMLDACTQRVRSGNRVTCFLLDREAFSEGVIEAQRGRRWSLLQTQSQSSGQADEIASQADVLSQQLRLAGVRAQVVRPQSNIAALLECT